MDIVISGRSALKMLRLVRSGGGVLEPCDNPPAPSRLRATDLPAIREALPKELASFDRERPLCLLFFCREDRPRLEAVDAGALLAKPPSGGFCKVAATEAVDVYVESPALVIVRVAQELNACTRAMPPIP